MGSKVRGGANDRNRIRKLLQHHIAIFCEARPNKVQQKLRAPRRAHRRNEEALTPHRRPHSAAALLVDASVAEVARRCAPAAEASLRPAAEGGIGVKSIVDDCFIHQQHQRRELLRRQANAALADPRDNVNHVVEARGEADLYFRIIQRDADGDGGVEVPIGGDDNADGADLRDGSERRGVALCQRICNRGSQKVADRRHVADAPRELTFVLGVKRLNKALEGSKERLVLRAGGQKVPNVPHRP